MHRGEAEEDGAEKLKIRGEEKVGNRFRLAPFYNFIVLSGIVFTREKTRRGQFIMQ